MDKLKKEIFEKFANYNQAHIFRFWDKLNEDERLMLLRQAEKIDMDRFSEMVRSALFADATAQVRLQQSMLPVSSVGLPSDETSYCRWENAYQSGEQILRDGRVAVVTAAGGQGTRLGFEGPKGTFSVTPVNGKPLFQVLAEKIKFAEKRYGRHIHWFIMTSDRNHNETIEFFGHNDSFGLSNVHFVKQGLLPAVDFEGKMMLESKSSIAMHPDGHGGIFRALVSSGGVAILEEQGIDVISYCQVDNPLVNVIDPYFLGFHESQQSQMSSRMILKAYPEEKVGVFCSIFGRSAVVEYCELPKEKASERDQSNGLKFKTANAGIHIFSRNFAKSLGAEGAAWQLPLHAARKKIPTIDVYGNAWDSDSPNGIKFEKFVFDALQFANRSLILEGSRKDIFSPIKNSAGLDSPETCRQDQTRLFAKWLSEAGADIPTDATGKPPFNIEISPLFADNERVFLEKWNCLENRPAIAAGSYIK